MAHRNNITYIYSAAGEKLAKKMTNGTYQYYAGSRIYKNDKTLNYLLMEEGMVSKSSGGYVYEYQLKDHLGNARVTFQPDGTATTVKQATEYYPFGMNYPQSPGGTNKYLYNGKEKQDDQLSGTFLDWYDYGARFYDPVIGRWSVNDGKAEKYFSLSPYIYAANNPARFLDPDGNKIVDANGVKITYNKQDGWSSNATTDVIRAGNLLMNTSTGTEMFNAMDQAPQNITIEFSQETIQNAETGEFQLGNTDNVFDSNGEVKSSAITIYEGSINEHKSFFGSKFSIAQRIASVLGHEAVHATDKENQKRQKENDDKKIKNDKVVEQKPNTVESKILKEEKDKEKEEGQVH